MSHINEITAVMGKEKYGKDQEKKKFFYDLFLKNKGNDPIAKKYYGIYVYAFGQDSDGAELTKKWVITDMTDVWVIHIAPNSTQKEHFQEVFGLCQSYTDSTERIYVLEQIETKKNTSQYVRYFFTYNNEKYENIKIITDKVPDRAIEVMINNGISHYESVPCYGGRNTHLVVPFTWKERVEQAMEYGLSMKEAQIFASAPVRWKWEMIGTLVAKRDILFELSRLSVAQLAKSFELSHPRAESLKTLCKMFI